MSVFNVTLTATAQADMRRLAPDIQLRIWDKLAWMGENATLLHHQALQGDEWAGCFKYRVGDYRIIYKLDGATRTLVVLKIRHRREVYK